MYESLWQGVAAYLSVERMQADIAEFFALSRWSSFDKINSLARLIASKMEQAGLSDVRLIEAPADGKTAYGGWVMPKAYDVESARLCDVTGDGTPHLLADYGANPTSLMLYSRPTADEGITAEVVVADSLNECNSHQVTGKLVLTSCSGVEFNQAVMRAGAFGIICDGRVGRRFFKEGDYLNDTNEWHNYTIPPWDDPTKGFGFSISPHQGQQLRARVQTGETVRLHALVKTRHYDGMLPVVSGRLPGLLPEEIVITGHYDEFGADDNCSQVAVGLEALRAIGAMVEAGEMPPLQRGIRLLFPMEVRGFNALVQNPEETKHIRLGLNIDTVGTDQNEVTSTCTLTDSFAALPSFGEELLAELLERVAGETPLFRWKRVAADVIDNVFSEPLIGAPTPCIYHYSATHHLPLDTPDRICGRMLRDMARVTATYAGFVVNAGLSEALWLSELVSDHAVQSLRQTAARSLRPIKDAEQLRALRREVVALNDIYNRRLDSVRWLVPQSEILPTPEAVTAGVDFLIGDLRLLPREFYAERAATAQQQIQDARIEAEARIRERAAAFWQVNAREEAESLPVSRCVPVKLFRGFLAFEDLSHAERAYVTHELGIDSSWGASLWLQNSLMLANGKRTAAEIAVLLQRHCQHSMDVPHLERVFEFLAQRRLVRLRPYLTQSEVRSALEQAGLKSGDVVLGHFSLSGFGYIEGGAAGLIDTLLNILGPDGTLMLPTFTFSWLGHPAYEPTQTASRVGAVTDHFWRRAGVQRSLHPTHSFAAFGKLAAPLLQGHDHTQPPLGAGSPIARLAEAGGKILMFARKKANTSMHVGEYLAGVPGVELVCPIIEDEARREVVVPNCPWHVNFDPAYEQLYANSLICDVPLGESVIHTMLCHDAIEAQAAVARATPEVLLEPGCNCPYCENLKQYCREQGRL